MVAGPTTVVSEDTEAVSLIDHHRRTVLLGEPYDLGEVAEVTLHREDTIDDDELDLVLLALL